MSEAEKPSPKKAYEPPEFKVYGTVRDLTKSVAYKSNNPDGGTYPNPTRTA